MFFFDDLGLLKELNHDFRESDFHTKSDYVKEEGNITAVTGAIKNAMANLGIGTGKVLTATDVIASMDLSRLGKACVDKEAFERCCVGGRSTSPLVGGIGPGGYKLSHKTETADAADTSANMRDLLVQSGRARYRPTPRLFARKHFATKTALKKVRGVKQLGLGRFKDWIWDGEMEGTKMHGKGTITSPNGDVFEVHFDHGKMMGQGTITFNNGDVYVGHVKDGKMDGEGTFKWKNGIKYKGYFRLGELHGEGKVTYTNGDYYKGTFFYGVRKGEGKYCFANGDEVMGMWDEDVFQGDIDKRID